MADFTPKSTARKEKFIYQRRTPEQWRANIDANLLSKADMSWLSQLLPEATRLDNVLRPWESIFIEDLSERFIRYGRLLHLSDRQRLALFKIEKRLSKLGGIYG
jgi:hypothetical protein